MKTYARIERGIFMEQINPMMYDSEAPGWVEGDPSRIGEEIPIELRYTASIVATMVDITDIVPVPQLTWLYSDGVFSEPPIPGSSPEELAASARAQRDQLLRTVYDPGINMALRVLRMATTPEEQSYAEGKVVELDSYAEALLGIPEQSGFPGDITWPVAPTR